MNSELTETTAIENFLLHRMNEEEQQLFRVRLLIDPLLAEETEAQASVYKLVRRFWRRHTRTKLESIYQQLLKDRTFTRQLQ